MRLLVFKEYAVLFFLVLLTGCASLPKPKTVMEVCNAADNQTNLSQEEPSKEELLAELREIELLEAEVAEQRSKLRRTGPRRHFVGARAKDASVAIYMEAFRQKVEKFGNDHYPEFARKNHVYGKLRLTTSINSDGTLEKIVLDKSSGCGLLDNHALSIVRDAGPYPIFSKTMKRRFDILSITRTFTYMKEDDSSTASSPPD